MKAIIDSVGALWRKAERDAYRAWQAKSKVHKADHFLNFCITAHSLRDHFLEDLNVPVAEHLTHRERWDADPLLIAVGDIANLSKHFRLRHRRSGTPRIPKTKRLVQRQGQVLDVYMSPEGVLMNKFRTAHGITITTSDGAQHDLWTFQIDVLDYWRSYLRQHGVRVFRQKGRQFIDQSPDT